MKSKKGIEFSLVAMVVSLLVVLILLTGFINNWGNTAHRVADSSACKNSVKLSASSTTLNHQAESIKCPLQEKEIRGTTPEAIKSELGKRYLDFCKEFLQGRERLFGAEEETFCVLRNKITFSDKGETITDFVQYLANEEATVLDRTRPSPSILDFCAGFSSPRADDILSEDQLNLNSNNLVIDTSKEYAFIFVQAKGEDEIRNMMDYLFGTSGAHANLYFGTGLMVGGGILLATGVGSFLGTPMILLGTVLVAGQAAWEFHNDDDIDMDFASYFLIREFDEQQLQELPCTYLPSEQR